MSTPAEHHVRTDALREALSRPPSPPGTSMHSYLAGVAYPDTRSSPAPSPPPPHVLVAYGSKHGATAELASWVGDALQQAGLQVTVRPVTAVRKIAGFDAVVIGSAVYMGRWRRDARQFVRWHAETLRHKPVWLFSTGPLEHPAHGEPPAAPKHAEAIAAQIGARQHMTFGGALAPGARGFPDTAIARRDHRGHRDYRDPDMVRAWAAAIAAAIRPAAPR